MNELRVASVRALCDIGGSFLEVKGQVVLRHSRRFSDYANQPDSMLDLDEASVRFHYPKGPDLWERVEGISLSREQILIMIPSGEEQKPTTPPDLVPPGRDVRVKLICTGLQATGFIRVPQQLTTAAFLHEASSRFLALTKARIVPSEGWLWLDAADLVQEFCLINRHLITACIEARTLTLPGGAFG